MANWQVTPSVPFPAGLWSFIDTYHAGDGSIASSFCQPELFAQYVAEGVEGPTLWADRMYVIELRDGVWKIVTVGGVIGWMEAEVLAVPDSAPMIAELPRVELHRGEPAVLLYNAPGGEAIRGFETRFLSVDEVLGESADGMYYHIYDIVNTACSGYIRKTDCEVI